MQLLLERGANPNAQDKNDMSTVLYAVAFGKLPSLEILLPEADLKVCNAKKRSLLHYAAVKKDSRCLELILNQLRDLKSDEILNQRDVNQETALHLAALAKRKSNIKLLLEFGADPTLGSKSSLTPAHYSSFLCDTNSLKEFIETEKIDITMEDVEGRTLLHLAAMQHPKNITTTRLQYNCIQYLSQLKEIDLNAHDSEKQTALGHAVRYNCDLARVLIEAGANVDGQKKYRRVGTEPVKYVPPLHHAVQHNQTEIVQLLLKQTPQINILDCGSKTALHIAVERENLKTVELLLLNKADPGIRNVENKTSLEIAVDQGNPSLVALMIKYAVSPLSNSVYEINLGMFLPKDASLPETELLNRINAEFNDIQNKKILLLPAARVFLSLKLKCLRKLEIVMNVMTLLFLGLGFNYFYRDAECHYKYRSSSSYRIITSDETMSETCLAWDGPVNLSWIFWLLLWPSFIISEWVEFRSYPGGYLTNIVNWLDIILIIAGIVLWPGETFISVEARKVIVIVSMIICGLDFILSVGDMIPFGKTPILMFRAVMIRAFLLMIPFMPLLLCFTVAFHMVMQVDPTTEEVDQGHRRVFYSFMQVWTYMIGNIEWPDVTKHLPIENKITLSFLVMSFIFLIIVVIMNLLTGMAVNITEDFRKDAEYRATKRKIVNTYQRESLLLYFKWFRNKTKETTLKTKLRKGIPDDCGSIKIRMHTFKDVAPNKFTEKLRLYMGYFDETTEWPMKLISLKDSHIADIDRVNKIPQLFEMEDLNPKMQRSVGSLSSNVVTTDTQSLYEDIELIKDQLGSVLKNQMLLLKKLQTQRRKLSEQ